MAPPQREMDLVVIECAAYVHRFGIGRLLVFEISCPLIGF